ncbi:hypothetical protein [Bacillus sp. FJAT-27231]|uniref:hypothetical protein n=1 Tax=Bacillus sp. FJAT-27231 TaxID=1679168 RepID=UPI000AAA0B21|nr:hypothetical protein [Bacillus sp. FJAT-27231]
MTLNRKSIQKAGWYGLLSGIFLAIFFKVIEQSTHLKVYTLLLNVDYIPIINRYHFPEMIEVAFHLVISILLSITLAFVLHFHHIPLRKNAILWCTAACLLIGLLLFPTTAFSDRTPSITSIPSLLYWLGGHALYGFMLGCLFARERESN